MGQGGGPRLADRTEPAGDDMFRRALVGDDMVRRAFVLGAVPPEVAFGLAGRIVRTTGMAARRGSPPVQGGVAALFANL